MKFSVLPIAALGLALASFLSSAHAAPSAVTIRVEQANKVDTEKHTRTQRRTLNIHVTNVSSEAMELKVKFAIFGRDVESREIVTVEQGEMPASVASRVTEKIETPAAVAVSEEEHSVKKKKVEASGAKIVGHGVQVMKGDVVVGEFYDPASMKEQWGKAKAMPKPAAKPAPKK